MINYKYLGIIILLVYLLYNYNNKPKYNLYNGPYWYYYRLGDIINGYMIRSNEPGQKKYLEDISTRWPESISDKYVKRSSYPHSFKIRDLNILIDILNEINDEKPSTNTLVIHLRLGDVVGMWNKGILSGTTTSINHYVKGPEYYKQILQKIKQNNNIQNIKIITGTHFNQDIDASINYLDHIVSIFDSDYDVEVKITNNPDKDFYYMCHSKFFCPSGGGFSNLIKDIVVKQNNLNEIITH